ncbi:trehalose-phosphatase [Alloacidobacterium sp.]|uniref:trehalose-phosphatase n=1 Tax=Alloacidobacterium sp. TaxID=2951999 RepID=UPI002D536C74|nr:trehalose-phosphatase [Alloacidobacterium sp.]HYK37866.1 trehalose-phosphatase [Alloacidobacterium sp.]
MLDRNRHLAVADFFQHFNSQTTALLVLDYDGTLAPFQTNRHKARPYPGIIPLLDRINRSGRTNISIVSGRPVSEIQTLLNPLTGLELWGAHGLEHLSSDGTYRSEQIEPETLSIIRQAEDWLRQAGLLPITEIKPGGLAVHWRGLSAPEIEDVQGCIQAKWHKFDGVSGVKLLAFDGGIEIRAAHPDKGDALRAILEKANPTAPAAFMGDDLTDEDAFRVLDRRGLSILVRSEYRTTNAKVWIRPPEELIDFLELWAEAAC